MVKIISIFLFITLLSNYSFAESKKSVWIDYDVATGMIFKDVDDGLALIHGLLSQDSLDIKGISSVFGNTRRMKKMKRITVKILKKLKATHIPFYTGARGSYDLGRKTEAYFALVNALEQGPLTIMAMGRMTNVATVVMHRPDLVKNINEVIINAGRRLEYPTYVGPKKIVFADYNIDGDTDAVKVLEEFNTPITMIPVESMKNTLIRKKELRKMRKSGSITKWMAKKAKFWRFLYSLYSGQPGFLPWDIFIVSYLTHPEHFSCDKKIPYKMNFMKNDTNRLLLRHHPSHKDFLVASYSLDSPSLGTYCYFIDANHIDTLINYWHIKQQLL